MFGFKDSADGRRRMVERVERRAVEEESQRCGVPLLAEEADARLSDLPRGWYWDSQEFREKLEHWIGKVLPQHKARGYRSALERHSHDLARAEKLLVEGLARGGLSEKELPALTGSDPRKLALAAALENDDGVPKMVKRTFVDEKCGECQSTAAKDG